MWEYVKRFTTVKFHLPEGQDAEEENKDAVYCDTNVGVFCSQGNKFSKKKRIDFHHGHCSVLF
jgi:hypothetical protein